MCKTDFDIWDRVLARCRPMRLETISRAAGHRDHELMWEAQRVRGGYGREGGRRPMAWQFPDGSFGVNALGVPCRVDSA